MLKFVDFIIAILCMSAVTDAVCTIDTSLKNATVKEQQEKLLKTLDPIVGKRSQQLKTTNGYSYDFIVCGDVDGGHPGVSIIQTLPTNKETKALGRNNRTLVSSEGSWLQLTLLGGDPYNGTCNNSQREARIVFVCDPYQKEIQMRALGEYTKESCYLQFVVSHQFVCPAAPEEGLSGGAIFFILLFVTVSAYFTFGFFYLRLVKGAKGIEQIPNVGFWFRVGNFLADGCGAIFRCDQYCGGNTSAGSVSTGSTYNGYSPIEERMARDLQEGDRDSALLSP